MSLRDRRLLADYKKMVETFSTAGNIKIQSYTGDPPDRYIIEFLVKSPVLLPNGTVSYKNSHTAEVYLTNTYPRQGPQCRMLSPVFHPNIAPHAICIGDH
ncbi:MAG: hypothetical protein GX221_09735 [Candidatus Riflebacteria bacterium]|nr:hypothetical protein [Candidatus Riflebacteria bacterium]